MTFDEFRHFQETESSIRRGESPSGSFSSLLAPLTLEGLRDNNINNSTFSVTREQMEKNPISMTGKFFSKMFLDQILLSPNRSRGSLKSLECEANSPVLQAINEFKNDKKDEKEKEKEIEVEKRKEEGKAIEKKEKKGGGNDNDNDNEKDNKKSKEKETKNLNCKREKKKDEIDINTSLSLTSKEEKDRTGKNYVQPIFTLLEKDNAEASSPIKDIEGEKGEKRNRGEKTGKGEKIERGEKGEKGGTVFRDKQIEADRVTEDDEEEGEDEDEDEDETGLYLQLQDDGDDSDTDYRGHDKEKEEEEEEDEEEYFNIRKI